MAKLKRVETYAVARLTDAERAAGWDICRAPRCKHAQQAGIARRALSTCTGSERRKKAA